jgi:hypothetical protein
MFPGLRHDAVVGGNDQQGMRNAGQAAQHVGQKFFMAGYINETGNAASASGR